MAYTSEIEKLERRWNENPLGLTFAPFAEACRKAGDHTRALELLEIGLAQHPNYVPAHIVRGRCHLDTSNEEAAELAFLRVLELDPENAIGLRSLAEICERTGRVAEAIRRLETLIEVDRSNEDARQQLHRLRTAPPAPQDTAPPAAAPAQMEPQPPVQPPEPPGLMDLAESEESVEAALSEPIAAVAEDDLIDIAVYEPDDLSAGTGSEFQLPSDSEALSTSGERLADVVLGSEITEQLLPAEYSAEGEGMIAAPDATAAGSAPLPGAELAQEPVVPEVGTAAEGAGLEAEPLPDQEATATSWAGSMFEPRMPEPEVAEAAPSLLEEDAYLAEAHEPPAETLLVPEDAETRADHAGAPEEPIAPEASTEQAVEPVQEPAPEVAEEVTAYEPELTATEPELDPAFEPEPELEHETVSESEPESEPEPQTVPVAEEPGWVEEEPASAAQQSPDGAYGETEQAPSQPEPSLVVTESMAEVFLRQGHPELALAVYTQLSQRDPENRRVSEAISQLRERLAPADPPATSAPRYDAASTGGRSVASRLGELLGAARPAVAASVHPPAFEAPRRAAEPTRPAEDSLSLSSVFGEESGSAPVGPASGPAESPENEPSFDEFFAPQEAAELPSRPAPAQEAAGAPAQSGEDLERFNSWLRGLKG